MACWLRWPVRESLKRKLAQALLIKNATESLHKLVCHTRKLNQHACRNCWKQLFLSNSPTQFSIDLILFYIDLILFYQVFKCQPPL